MEYEPGKELKERISNLPQWKLEQPRHVDKFDDRYPQCMRELRDRGFSHDEL